MLDSQTRQCRVLREQHIYRACSIAKVYCWQCDVTHVFIGGQYVRDEQGVYRLDRHTNQQEVAES